MTGRAGLVQRLVSRGAVCEIGKSPAARARVFVGVLDHELDIQRGGSDGRFQSRKSYSIMFCAWEDGA